MYVLFNVIWHGMIGVRLNCREKNLIVVGEHRPFDEKQRKAIEAFCENYNVVVYVNHLSNYHGKYSIQGNLLVACGGMKKLHPDI